MEVVVSELCHEPVRGPMVTFNGQATERESLSTRARDEEVKLNELEESGIVKPTINRTRSRIFAQDC